MRIVKNILFWLLGVVLGVAVLLGAVMAASYSFTGEGSLPDSAAQFGGVELEANGSCWQAPLLGGLFDRGFRRPSTLSVQKLGTLYEAHPSPALPAWATASALTITDGAGGSVLFSGTAQQYEDFLYPANGEYKAELTVWRLPAGMDAAAFAEPADGALVRSPGLERPARASGYYRYAFRYTIEAAAELSLSAERMEQGGVICLRIGGMVGSSTPAVESDLGNVQCVRSETGWVCYIPAAYNAEAGAHTLTVHVNGQTLERSVVVTAKDFGEAEAPAEAAATEAANEQFRSVIWPLYEAEARPKGWQGAFLCPLENYSVLLDYGQTKLVNGQRAGRSNSTLLYAVPGDPVRAPAGGVVAVAQELALTGNTVVIDHGCGLRSYLYGLASLSVQPGQSVSRGDALGPAGETLTMDYKLGSKSINPWPLFQASGGLFWHGA